MKQEDIDYFKRMSEVEEKLRRGDYIKIDQLPYEQTPLGKMEAELRASNAELERFRNQLADYKAQEDYRHSVEDEKARKDSKKNFRNDALIAIISSVVSVTLDHYFGFVELFFEFLKSFIFK